MEHIETTSEGGLPSVHSLGRFNSNGISTARHGTDAALKVRFYTESDPYKLASEYALKKAHETGEPLKKEDYPPVVMVETIVPGGKEVRREQARHTHYERFPEQYRAFKTGGTKTIGTPLCALGDEISEQQIKHFKHDDIDTIEALAGVSDGYCQAAQMGAFDLRQKAYDFIQAKNMQAISSATLKQNEELKEILAAQQAQIDELLAAQGERSSKTKAKKSKEGTEPKESGETKDA